MGWMEKLAELNEDAKKEITPPRASPTQEVEELLNLYERKRLLSDRTIRIIRQQGKVAVEEEIRRATSGMKVSVVGALIFLGISFYVFYAYWTYMPMIMLWPLSYYLVLGFFVFLGVLCWVGASLSYDRRKRMRRLIEAFERAEIKGK